MRTFEQLRRYIKENIPDPFKTKKGEGPDFGKNLEKAKTKGLKTYKQKGLDLYKAGGPFIPDKEVTQTTGKKVTQQIKKPYFGKPTLPKKTTKAPDRKGLKQAISDVRAGEKRLYDAGVGKKPSLVQQRKFTLSKIKQLSRETTKRDAINRAAGNFGSTEGSAGASGSSKTVTPTKGVKQSEVSKKAKDFTKKINQQRKVTTSGTPMRKGATKDVVKDTQISKMKDRIKELGGQREKLRSAPGKKDVTNIRKVNKEIMQYTKSIKSNPLVPTVYNKKNIGAKKSPNTFKTFKTPGGNKVTQSTRSLTDKNKGSVKFDPPKAKVSSPPLSPKGKKFVSRIPKFLKKSKTLTNIGKAAVKNPYVASAVGVGLAAAGAYAGYKAFQNRQKEKQKLTYKDFKSLSTPSDPDKGKIIHTRDIPKMKIKKGDVAKFPSPNKIPKSTSAEFKSNYAYK
tara:strand:+ start:247 stop:1599 length:1353 start_codon:yes stop_codon:yes gene_type:complete